jgi:hypothetical protein
MLSDCVLWEFFGSRKDRKDTQRKKNLCETLRALRDLFPTPGTPKHTKKINENKKATFSGSFLLSDNG